MHAASGFFVYDPHQSATLSSNTNSSRRLCKFIECSDSLLSGGAARQWRGQPDPDQRERGRGFGFFAGHASEPLTPLTVFNHRRGIQLLHVPANGPEHRFCLPAATSLLGRLPSSIPANTPYTAISAGGIDPVKGIVYGYAYSATVSSANILTPMPYSGLLLSYNLPAARRLFWAIR